MMNIELGAEVRVTRMNGEIEHYVLRGTDAQGPILFDSTGQRNHDFGTFRKVEKNTGNGWVQCAP